MFAADREEEKDATSFNLQAARSADEDRDIGTRVPFERVLIDVNGHKEWPSKQRNLLK